jgi:hypothetical protein
MLRDDGISRAAQHADAVSPEWGEKAYAILLEYGPKLSRFTPFDIRACAIARGLDSPPDGRAWGNAFKRARKAKKLAHAGYVPHPDPKCHRCPTSLWQWVG